MITFLRLKNFMSFHNVKFDFTEAKGAKHFAAIYGENGSGKSNFVEALDFLRMTLFSFEFSNFIDQVMDEIGKRDIPDEILESVRTMDIKHSMKKVRMIDCDEDTTIELGFLIDGHHGTYEISFDDSFKYEKLYYFTGKQSGTIFEVSKEADLLKSKISGKLFLQPQAKNDIREAILKYWGKHTLLSILCQERKDKNSDFIKSSYLEYAYALPDMLMQMAVYKNEKEKARSFRLRSRTIDGILDNLETGHIEANNKEILDRSENILREFFTQAYSDVKDVYYKRKNKGDLIHYRLYFKKMIAGKIRSVDITRESAGTRRVLDIIHSLLGVFCNMTVIYDEIDNGIHDLLLKSIFTSLIDDINGQLIITTHNTLLLDEIRPSSAYVIQIDYTGEKDVTSLDNFGRIQPNNNIRKMYLNGLFGGVPESGTLYYDEISEILHSGLNDFNRREGGNDES